VFGKRSTTDARPAPAAPAAAALKPAAAAPVPQGNNDRLAPLSSAGLGAPLVSAPATPARLAMQPPAMATDTRRSESYYETKGIVFGALIEAIDLAQLARLDTDAAREEIRDIVNEIIAIKNIVMSISEQEELLDDICNDVLGYARSSHFWHATTSPTSW
jgi:Flp pilus assembly protein, ATPase CpaF